MLFGVMLFTATSITNHFTDLLYLVTGSLRLAGLSLTGLETTAGQLISGYQLYCAAP